MLIYLVIVLVNSHVARNLFPRATDIGVKSRQYNLFYANIVNAIICFTQIKSVC